MAVLFSVLNFVYWALQDISDILRCLSVTQFLGKVLFLDTYRQGKTESHSWVAGFCFAFVSKQMHSCHSWSHWRLVSNIISSKTIPMDWCLLIQLFQVSVKSYCGGQCRKHFKYEFKYRWGHENNNSCQSISKATQLRYHYNFTRSVFSPCDYVQLIHGYSLLSECNTFLFSTFMICNYFH